MIKGKEEVNVFLIACNNYNPNLKNQNYAPNYPKPPYPTNQGASNNYETSTCNRPSLEETLNAYMTAQTEQNKTFTDILKFHDDLLGQVSTKLLD